MVHVHLQVSHREWLDWAHTNGIHHLVIEYIQTRPDHLWSQPPKHEEPFSTSRSWHMLSDALHEYGDGVDERWWLLRPPARPASTRLPAARGPPSAFGPKGRDLPHPLNAGAMAGSIVTG
jgi:hypothetical protein